MCDHLAALSSEGDTAARAALARCMRLASWTHDLAARRLYPSVPIEWNTIQSVLHNRESPQKAHSLSLVRTINVHSPPAWDVARHLPTANVFPNATLVTFTAHAVSDLSFAPHPAFKAFLAAQRPQHVCISLLEPEADWHRPQRDWLGWLADLLVHWGGVEVVIHGFDYTRILEPVKLSLPGKVRVFSNPATVGPSYWHAVAQTVARAERATPRPEVLELDSMPKLTCPCVVEYEDAAAEWKQYVARVAQIAASARETETLERLEVDAQKQGIDCVAVFAARIGCTPTEYGIERARAAAHKEGITLRHLQIQVLAAALGRDESLEAIQVVLPDEEVACACAAPASGVDIPMAGEKCTDPHIWQFKEPGGHTWSQFQ